MDINNKNEVTDSINKVSKKKSNWKKISTLITISLLIIMVLVGARFHIFENYKLIYESMSEGKIETEVGEYFGNPFLLGENKHDGKFVFFCGDAYDGYWNSKSFEGKGKYLFKGIGVYDGEFLDGVREGNGIFTWDDRSIYEGEWKNDQMCGAGEYTFANGDVLVGNFDNNCFISGFYKYKKEYISYEYYILDGKFTNKIIITLDNGTKYIGTFSNKEMTGYGKIQYSNGDIYIGHVERGKKDGNGVYQWVDGEIYSGQWKNDKMNGIGIYAYKATDNNECLDEYYITDDIEYLENNFPSKEEFKNLDVSVENPMLKGKFKNNKPDGICNYYDFEDEKFKTEWKKGKCIKIWK